MRIKKYMCAFLAFSIASIMMMPCSLHAVEKQQNVLFISSYSLSYPTVSQQIKGIQDGLDGDIYIYYEFMDSMTIHTDDYIAKFYDYIRYKYTRLNGLDAIITGDDSALQMVLRYSNGFFKDIPIVYESINSRTRAELANRLGMKGILERSTIQDNLDLGTKLFPETNKIIAITDDSETGKALAANVQAIRSKYAGINTEIFDVSMYTHEQIIKKLKQVDDQSIVLYISFTHDGDNKSYTYEEALKTIVSHVKCPVFTSVWMGQGSLGSIEADYESIGKKAGEMTNRIIQGQSVQSMDASTTTTVTTMDLTVMNHFHLSKNSMPAQTTYVHDHDMSKVFRMIISILGIILTLLLILLIRSRIENRKKEKQMILLKDEAEVDSLTQLKNRRALDNELEIVMKAQRHFTFYLLDIDDFKGINDNYGHASGDAVLKETGMRLTQLKNRIFLPFRYGGDEFAIIYFCKDTKEAQEKGLSILELFEEDFIISKKATKVSVSIGSASYPEDATTIEELVRKTDTALYDVKKSSKDNYRPYQ